MGMRKRLRGMRSSLIPWANTAMLVNDLLLTGVRGMTLIIGMEEVGPIIGRHLFRVLK